MATMTAVQDDWVLRAKCHGHTEEFFLEGAEQRRARVVCATCPVQPNCLAEALDGRIEWGVWGGMTERERRSLLRERTDVASWKALLVGP